MAYITPRQADPTVKVITDRVTKRPIPYYTTFIMVLGIEPYKIWKVLKPKVYDLKHYDFKRKIPPFIAPTLEEMTAFWEIKEDEVLDCISEFSVLEEDLQEAFKDQFSAFEPYKNLDRLEFHPLLGYTGIGPADLISQDQKTIIIFSNRLFVIDPRLIWTDFMFIESGGMRKASYQPQFFDILFSHGRHLVIRLRDKKNIITIVTARCQAINLIKGYYADGWVPPEHVQQLLHRHLMTLDRGLSDIIKILFNSVLYKYVIAEVVSYLYTTYKDKELILIHMDKDSTPQILRYRAGKDLLELQIIPKSYAEMSGFDPVIFKQAFPDSFPSLEVKLFINNQQFPFKEYLNYSLL